MSGLDRNDRKSLRTEGIKRSEINCYQALFDHFISQNFLFALQEWSSFFLSLEMNMILSG